jgi:hypothetical protein
MRASSASRDIIVSQAVVLQSNAPTPLFRMLDNLPVQLAPQDHSAREVVAHFVLLVRFRAYKVRQVARHVLRVLTVPSDLYPQHCAQKVLSPAVVPKQLRNARLVLKGRLVQEGCRLHVLQVTTSLLPVKVLALPAWLDRIAPLALLL